MRGRGGGRCGWCAARGGGGGDSRGGQPLRASRSHRVQGQSTIRSDRSRRPRLPGSSLMDAEPHLTVADRQTTHTIPDRPPTDLRLATALVGASTWPELRRAAEPAIRDVLRVGRARLVLTEAYLTAHVDLTTPPPHGPLLRLPLEAAGRPQGVLELTADAETLAGVRPQAERVATLVATRLAELRTTAPPMPAASMPAKLDALDAPVAIT